MCVCVCACAISMVWRIRRFCNLHHDILNGLFGLVGFVLFRYIFYNQLRISSITNTITAVYKYIQI